MASTQAIEAPAPSRAPLAVQALIAPDAGMARVARIGRVRGALLFAMACSIALGIALASRVDAREATLKQLDMQGRLASMSDRQIEDAQKSAERVFIVKKIARGAAAAPAELLLSAIGLFALSWFLRGRSKSGEILNVSAYALLPSALGNLAETGATMLRGSIAPDAPPMVPRTLGALWTAISGQMIPPVSAAAKLLNVVDVFDLWGAVMLGFGLATAAQLPARKAVVATLVGWLCYRLIRTVAIGA